MDFALAGRPSFLDVFAGMNDLPYVGHVRIGHFFEPFSLERITRNRFTTFMERALPDQPFAPARNLGIMIFDWSDDEMMTWHLGTFYVNSDVWGDAVGDSHGHSVTGRMTRLLWYDEPSGGRYYFHVGGGYSFRGSDHKRVRYRAQPEARLGSATPNIPFFVDTGDIPANFNQLFNIESAWIRGPWSAQAEYFWVPVDRIDGPNPSFEGWYFQTTYFLTGEHRPYNRKDGTMDRVYPHEDFFRVNTPAGICTGKGAWEVAFRVSHLDLDSQGINGGKVTDLTVGLNWYMNPWTRVTTDWVHSFLDRAPGGNSHADLWGIRMGFEF
jgi:phosphate-selective porin OprO/OprP